MEGNNSNQNLNTQQQSEAQKKSIGPMIGIAIIVVIIIFGGLYYWGSQINTQEIKDKQESLTAEQIESQEDLSVKQLETQSTSDEIADIEIDINATDLENLDKELGKKIAIPKKSDKKKMKKRKILIL